MTKIQNDAVGVTLSEAKGLIVWDPSP